MRRIVFNQKGGVGKTSISCNLAAISASRGFKTLIVDLDIQGNATHYLIGKVDEEAYPSQSQGVAALFKQSVGRRKSAVSADDFVWETPHENLFLMPASIELKAMEHDLESRYKIFKLRDALDELRDIYDRVYIDTPPNFNFYTKSALIAADRLLIPFDCDSFARQSLLTLIENIDELRDDHNPDLSIEGIIINQFSSRANLPKSMIQQLTEDGFKLFEAYLSSSVKMKESHHLQRPLIDLAPSHKLTQNFLALHSEIESL